MPPVDPKRNCGPEDAYEPPILRPTKTKDQLLESEEKPRPDGRRNDQLRPFYMKTGIITKAQGSVYIEQGQTKIVAAIYGPKEVLKREDFSLKGKVMCEFKYMPFSRATTYSEPRQSFEEKVISKTIAEAMEGVIILSKFPKSEVLISIQMIQDDGGTLSLAMTAASVALIDAKIEVRDLVIGCTIRFYNGGRILVDPTSEEEHTKTSEGAGFHLAVMPSLSQVTALKQAGKIEHGQARECIEACWEGCLRIATAVKKLLEETLGEQPG